MAYQRPCSAKALPGHTHFLKILGGHHRSTSGDLRYKLMYTCGLYMRSLSHVNGDRLGFPPGLRALLQHLDAKVREPKKRKMVEVDQGELELATEWLSCSRKGKSLSGRMIVGVH
ncbi:UNVERIFIED_CONTAM: hypothetical protein K2H54_046203 [Gekko kuhli]